MPGGYGHAGFVGIAKETTWGTAVAATDFMEAMSEGITKTIDRFDTRNMNGGFYEPDDADGVHRVGGPLSTAGFAFNMPWLFGGALGSVHSVTVITSGTLFANSFKPNTADAGTNNPYPSFTLEVFRDVTSSYQVVGALVNRLRMSGAPNAPLMLEAEYLARTGVHIAKTTPTLPSSPSQPFTFDTCSISLGGAANATLESFGVTIDNQLEGVVTLDVSTRIAKIRRTGPQLIGFEAVIGFENITDYDRFIAQTELAFKANFTKANSFSALIDLPKVVYTTHPLGVSGRGRQTVAINGKARYLASSATAILCTVTNNTSGGYI